MITREALVNDFLKYLSEVLNDPRLIDVAVKEHGSVKMHNRIVGLSELPKTHINKKGKRIDGAFDENGQKNQTFCEANGIVFKDENRFSMEIYENQQKKLLGKLPLKTRIILTAAILHAEARLHDQYKIYQNQIQEQQHQIQKSETLDPIEKESQFQKLEEEWREIVKQIKAVSIDIFQAWSNYNDYVDFDFNQMKPEMIMQSFLQRGAFQFPNSNIFISGGPHKKRAPEDDPDHFASTEPTMSAFLDSLERHKIDDIIAIGKTLPYYPENKQGQIVKTEVNSPDFLNYFIPNAKGPIKFQDNNGISHKIESKPVKKVGRIITYEIRIDDSSKPIFVHHFPKHDRRPLDLDPNELAYIQSIQKKDNKVLTHCRGGRGRSGQIAYILTSSLEPYRSEKDPNERLAALREVRTGDPSSSDFIETDEQKEYLTAAEFNEDLKNSKHVTPISDRQLDVYFQLLELMQIEIERNKTEFDIKKPLSDYTAKENKYIELADLFNQFQFAASFEDALLTFNLFQLIAVSKPLREINTENISLLIQKSSPNKVSQNDQLELSPISSSSNLAADVAINLVQTIIKMNTSKTPIDTDNFFELTVRNLSLDDFDKLLISIKGADAIPQIDRLTYCIYLATAYIKKFDANAHDEISINNRRNAMQFISDFMRNIIDDADKIFKNDKVPGNLREKTEVFARALLVLERSCHPVTAPQPELEGEQNFKSKEEEIYARNLAKAKKIVEMEQNFRYAKDYANYLKQIIRSSPTSTVLTRDHAGKTFKSESQHLAELKNTDAFIKKHTQQISPSTDARLRILGHIEREILKRLQDSNSNDANVFRIEIKKYLLRILQEDFINLPAFQKFLLFLNTKTDLDIKSFHEKVENYLSILLLEHTPTFLQSAIRSRRSLTIHNSEFETQLDKATEIIRSNDDVGNLDFQKILKHLFHYLRSEASVSPELDKIFNELNKAISRNREPSIKLSLRKLIETLYRDKVMPAKIKEGLSETATLTELKKAALLCLVNIVEDRVYDKIHATRQLEEKAALKAATEAAEKTKSIQFQREYKDAKHDIETKPTKTLSEAAAQVSAFSSKPVSPPKVILIDDVYFTHPQKNKSDYLHDVLTQAANNKLKLVVLVKEQTNINDLKEKIALFTPYLKENVIILTEISSNELAKMKYRFNKNKKKESKTEMETENVKFDPTLARLEKALELVNKKQACKSSDLFYISPVEESRLDNVKKEGFHLAHFSDMESPIGKKPVEQSTLVKRLQEINYSLGYYNDMITILNIPPNEHKDAKVTPFNEETIPNFKTIGFLSTPIVLHVSVTNFREWIDFRLRLTVDPKEEAMLEKSLFEFALSAVDRFDKLTGHFQRSAALEVYRYLEDQINFVHETLFDLRINNESMDQQTIDRELIDIQKKVNALVELNDKYRQTIGETFLTNELRKLQLLLAQKRVLERQDDDKPTKKFGVKLVTEGQALNPHTFQRLRGLDTKKSTKNEENKSTKDEETESTKDEEKKSTKGIDKESTTHTYKRISFLDSMESQIYSVLNKPVHPALQNDTALRERQTKEVNAQKDRINPEVQKLVRRLYALEEKQVPSVFKLDTFTLADLDVIVDNITMPTFTDPLQLKNDFQRLLQLKIFFEDISALAKVCADPDAVPKSIQKLSDIRDLEEKVKQSGEFMAMEFLEKAKSYLISNKISNNVAREQLKVIEEADKTGRYIDAKDLFISLGEKRKQAPWAKPHVNQYFDLFKPKEESPIQKETRILAELTKKKL